MKFQLRDYQQKASNAAISHYKLKNGRNYLMVLPTGAGKSLIIADIAARLNEPLLVFQPNKEILEQNFAKLQTYGIFDAGCYSASVKRKDINRITFATIGSVYNHMEDFKHFRYILIDECHLVNPKEGMYADFFAAAERRIIGLTATPYRFDAKIPYAYKTESFFGRNLLLSSERTACKRIPYQTEVLRLDKNRTCECQKEFNWC